MASERNTERIIDLLYGELTADESSELRGEFAESPELRAEHDELSAMLSEIRTALPEVEVPSSVHQSIMDAARNAALGEQERRKPIPVEPPQTRGLWQRITEGKGAQIALVATVLFAGAFVTRFVNLNDNRMDEQFGPASENVAFDVPLKKNSAKFDSPAADPGIAPELAKTSTNDRGGANELQQKRELKEEPKPVEPIADSKGFADALGDENADVQTTRKPAAKKRSVARPKPTKKAEPKSKSMKDSEFFFDSSSTAKNVDDSYRQDQLNNSGFAPVAEKAAEEVDAVVEDKADKKAERAEGGYEAPNQSIGTVEQHYASGDYATTIQSADEFVALGSGSRTDRARALQLKAQALSRSGRYQESLRVYDSLIKNFSSYQSSAVNSARAEVSRKLEESPRKQKESKRKSKPKKAPAYDFDAEQVAPSSKQ